MRNGLHIAIILFAFLQQIRAQSIFDALSFGPGVSNVGYFADATGWTFIPTKDLRVVSVGCLPMQGSFLDINFWDGTNRLIATYPIALQNGQGGDVLCQAVDGPTLKAGTPYGISVESTNGNTLPVRLYSRQGADGTPTFNTSPFFTGFKNFEISTNGQWSPLPSSPANNGDWLFFGSTFQFQVLRELSFSETGDNVALSWPTQAVTYAVQQNHDFNITNWLTLTNAPVVVGSQNQIIIPKPSGTIFYRLVSQ